MEFVDHQIVLNIVILSGEIVFLFLDTMINRYLTVTKLIHCLADAAISYGLPDATLYL